MSAVAKRFRTDEEALAFLDGQDDYLQEQDRLIAQGADPAPLTPEDVAAMNRPVGPMPELAALPGEDPIMRADLYGNLPPELLEEEPPLPVADERFQAGQETGDEMLPPVQTQVARPMEATFQTDDDAAAFLDAPAEALAPDDKAAPGPVKFETDKAAADFLETLPALPGPAGSSQLAYDTTVRPENVEGPIPFGEKDRPYRTRSDGTLEFDPRRMRDGVTQALKDQVITGEQFAKLQPSIEAAQKVIENEAKLRARAKDNGALASALQGFGRGGAMTLGAIGGSKAGAAAGLLTGPYAPVASPALGLVGGVAGAVTMGMNYDLVYKELAKHYEEYDAVLAAAELNPGWNTAGELVSVAVGVPQAVRGAATALATTRAAEGAAGVARQVGTAAGLGAGSGVAGYSLDRTVRGEPITPGGLATAAAAGAAFAPFMITPGAGGTQEMASITAKVRAGQPISPMERRIYEAAAPAMRAAFAEMDAAGGRYTGGRYDASGKWMPGMEVTVPTSSVLGLAPAAGRATVRLPYEVPARLGAPAVAKAQGFAARPTLAAGAEGAGTTAPVRAPRPTKAPVNVLPPGPTIVTPTQAMLGVEEYLARQVGLRGIQTKGNFEAILELMDEHKQIVTDAIGRNEPVSIDALDSYEIRVPYYDRDEETGLATYSEEGFKAYEAYLKGQDAEGAENVRTGGIDIFEAIRDSGGLPSGKSDKVKQWAGELKRIREAQNPGNALGVKGTLNLFRKDAPDLDGLIKNLQGYGFQVTTPAELFDLIDQRFKTGKPIYAYGAEEPLEMRGRRRPPAVSTELQETWNQFPANDTEGQDKLDASSTWSQNTNDGAPNILYGEVRRGDEVVGRIQVGQRGDIVEIDKVWVAPSQRRKGIAKKLIYDAMRRSGVTKAYAPNRTDLGAKLLQSLETEVVEDGEKVDRVLLPQTATDRGTEMLEMQGRRRPPTPGAPRQGELLGESDVEFSLVGQTDRTSLTPAEQAAAAKAEADKAEAEKGQGDLFGAPRAEENPTGLEAAAVERYQWMRNKEGGQSYGNQQITVPLNETIYQRDIKPGLREGYANTLKAYQAKHPSVTHVSYYKLEGRGDWKFDKMGSLDEVRPNPPNSGWVMPVDSFASPSAMAQGEMADSEAFPAASGAVSTDPLTPPLEARGGGAAGGPAQVPPGQPMGAAAASSPDWVLGPAETRDGRRLVKGIEGYKPGQRWGFRSIVDYVNKAVRMEMRRSKSQTSAVHPAHYKPANHMAYTRETQSQINFHEAGHGLEYLIRARVPAFFDTFADELIALTNRPGSMASDPPASASDKQKRQYQIGEGVAEWTRLLMTEPAAVANMRVTPALNAVAEQYYPGMAAALRDGARAVQRFQNRPVAERWAMFNADPSVAPTANEVIGRIIRGGQDVAAFLASGAPVSRLDRMIPRAIMANRDQVEMTYKQALAKMREVRAKTTAPLMQAHNMILSIGAEASNAIAGTKPGKGLRVIGPDGKFKQFTRESWRDLRRKIPSKLLPLFDSAAWARESLTRWEAAKMEYPGMREGISPDDLRAIVANATRTLRNRGINFDVRFAEQSAFFGEILNIKDFGGLKKPGEVDRMTQRDTYWPLPRVMQEGRGRAGKARGDIMSGDYRAFGSGEAIRQTDEVAEERVRAAYEAYYWNRFLNMLADKMAVVAKDQSLPIEARSIAGASIVRLNMPMKVAATVSKEEVIPWVIEAIKDQVEKVMGIRPELKPEDINLSWNFRDVWRPTKPGDAYVVSSLRDGERVFYQLGDPAMFGMFANPQTASKFGKFANWALGPMMQNWKRNITQGLVFAVRGLIRDTFSQPVLNTDAVAWIPGRTHMMGVVNKFTQKYPQVFQEGLLLSRIEPGRSELVNKVQHGAVWQWLAEGWYVSQAKDPVVRLLATVLQPSNWLMVAPPIVGAAIGGVPGALAGLAATPKGVDLINLITGGRTTAQFFETAGREGAAVSVLKRGGTDEEALLKYWTAGGQFNEHAGVADARIMMNIPGFFNPMIQGLRNAGQKLSDPDPAVAGTAWARMLIMMPLLFGAAAGARYLLMSKDEKDRERNRPVDDRMNFMDIGGFSVPFPYGVEGVMGSMIYNSVMDELLDRPRVEADKTAIMMMKRIFDPGSPLSVFGPQLSTLGEASFNWSVYRQKHIVSPWMAGLPASQQFYSTTPKFYQELGEWFNYSPAKLQYIMQQAISRQADETIRYMESLDRGRPIQEPADVPFVGRLFIREPLGFSSQPLRDAEVVETRLRDLDMRLQAKGWYGLRDANYPQDQLGTTEMRNLYMQLQYLEGLRFGLRRAGDISALAKTYALAENYAEERNTRRMLTTFVQSLLLGNKDMVERIDMATELLKQIPERTPQEKAAEYLERRF